jgi:hypothetical protein
MLGTFSGLGYFVFLHGPIYEHIAFGGRKVSGWMAGKPLPPGVKIHTVVFENLAHAAHPSAS